MGAYPMGTGPRSQNFPKHPFSAVKWAFGLE